MMSDRGVRSSGLQTSALMGMLGLGTSTTTSRDRRQPGGVVAAAAVAAGVAAVGLRPDGRDGTVVGRALRFGVVRPRSRAVARADEDAAALGQPVGVVHPDALTGLDIGIEALLPAIAAGIGVGEGIHL